MNRSNQIMLICQFLRTWRSSRRISQEKVYHSTGIDVCHYEIGRNEPGLKNLLVLCDYYQISFTWLLKLTEEVDSGSLSHREFLTYANFVD